MASSGMAPAAAGEVIGKLPKEISDMKIRDDKVEKEMEATVVDGNGTETGHIIVTTIGGRNGQPKQTISYMAERVVGQGSFGIVFQAKCLETGEAVAIKKVLQDKRYKNRELQTMRLLDHPNIVSLKHCFFSTTDKDELYLNLVLEYVPETAYRVTRHYSKANQRMPMIYVKLYTYQIFRALAYIHAIGVCHRDIKPQNLLVNPHTHQLKFCDFGSAKVLVKGEPNISYICSRYYRAPELIFGATEYTTAIDIWSVGCVLAEFLLGQFGSLLSAYGCFRQHKTCDSGPDQECYLPLTNENSTTSRQAKNHFLLTAAFWGYVFQIIFQMTAGAVMLTDSVYWIVIAPFLTILTIVAHSLNLVLLLGDTALNSLCFPWFRISYFLLLTAFYVLFEWILHAFVATWWPYPFLDLSVEYAPLWYLIVALLHLPCYGFFLLVVKLKYFILTRWFPQSHYPIMFNNMVNNLTMGQSLPYYGQQYCQQSYGGQPDYTRQSYGGYGQPFYGSQSQLGYGQPSYQLKKEPYYSQSSYGSEGETDSVDDSDEFVEDTYGGDDAEDSGSSINLNSDGTETGDESDEDPETVSYATNRAFASREDLQKWAKDRGRKYGFAIVIGRSRANESVELLCDRGPKRPSTAKVRDTGTIKNDCAFKLVGRYSGRSDCWSLEEICKLHNHKPFVFEEGHPYLRRLTSEQSDFVATLYKLHVKPRNILLALREKFPGNCCILKDIYNVTRKIREQDKVGRSPMEILENYLYANGFVFNTRVNEITNATEDIFFCHPLSYKMWRAFPHVVLIDTTYKTNFYNIPFVQLVGVTSTSKSFCIAHAFIANEREDNFTWVLKQAKGMIDKCMEPRIIVTDRDQALMRSCDYVFPNEMDRNSRWWQWRFNTEQQGRYDTVRNGLDWFDTVQATPFDKWMDFPGHALVMAQTFVCIVIQISNLEMADDEIHDDIFDEEMVDQPPQQRRRVDEHIGTLDQNEHLQFPAGNALKRYRKLRTMIPYRNTLIDWTLLESTGERQRAEEYIGVDTPWSRLFTMDLPAYRELTVEFYSTFRWRPHVDPLPDQSDDDDVDPPEVRFSMFGYQHQMDLPEFAWRTGLYTEAEVQQPLFTESIHTLPEDELKNFWPAIGDRQLTGDSKASDIRDPLYRYFHRLIACGINGRKDSTDKCNFRDVFYLRCLLTHRYCNLARCLAAYSSSYYHRQFRGSLLGGPYVTRIAHSYAYILNLHQLRIPPVPPMPCGVPTVRGMGMYATFPGIDPRLRMKKDAPPYVPVPLVEPDPLNAPEIQIDGDQPVHEEDPPQHPAIIYRVARFPPATQALLQRLDQRSEQQSREMVEMRHMMRFSAVEYWIRM
ncbi:hypothetical protein SSX86_016136 [Deinandra increscens subsp. villosa]|uniref:non-specific serine/threonine protein kinase n=1 Tax=Deinandra increscens subsp. villosa TaxID=3103831 RepID=A0AAP0GXT6_9ASTR